MGSQFIDYIIKNMTNDSLTPKIAFISFDAQVSGIQIEPTKNQANCLLLNQLIQIYLSLMKSMVEVRLTLKAKPEELYVTLFHRIGLLLQIILEDG